MVKFGTVGFCTSLNLALDFDAQQEHLTIQAWVFDVMNACSSLLFWGVFFPSFWLKCFLHFEWFGILKLDIGFYLGLSCGIFRGVTTLDACQMLQQWHDEVIAEILLNGRRHCRAHWVAFVIWLLGCSDLCNNYVEDAFYFGRGIGRTHVGFELVPWWQFSVSKRRIRPGKQVLSCYLLISL